MNLPNILTVLRLFLTVAFIGFFRVDAMGARLAATTIFILASLTDFFDGYYARKFKIETTFGKIMDPVADKFLMLSVFFMFVRMRAMPWWMFEVIAAREILVTLLRFWAMARGQVLAAEKMGKLKTVSQIAVVIVVLLTLNLTDFGLVDPFSSFMYGLMKGIRGLFYGMIFLTVLSGVLFLVKNGKKFFQR